MRPVWYTDGSAKGNGSKNAKGGFGVVCIDEDTDTILYQHQEQHVGTTNNRMEMMAIIHAVVKAYELSLPTHDPVIRSDSAYAVNTFTSWMFLWERNGWTRAGNKPVENLDLVKQMYNLHQNNYTCLLEKVRGHSNNKWNNYCDELATFERKI